MELALSLGGDPSKPFPFLDKLAPKLSSPSNDLGFCMGLANGVTSDPPRLSLRLPCHHLPDHNETGTTTEGSGKGFDVNRLSDEAEEGAALSSSPNSAMSSFQVDFGIRNGRGSDDDDNGSSRKKLRLSREQSAFLEESFKQHHTLNPKQKLAVAKQLNLRPRQVEVWFQNRRARTKLKQTEVDCEYLKRCCETLTEENRRLQKEVQELRVLKASQPFYMHSPATTLTMCPSCERVATTTSTTVSATADGKNGILSLIKTSG